MATIAELWDILRREPARGALVARRAGDRGASRNVCAVAVAMEGLQRERPRHPAHRCEHSGEMQRLPQPGRRAARTRHARRRRRRHQLESLPCPCLKPGSGGGGHKPKPSCQRPRGLVRISFSATRYPDIRRHFIDAVHAGWPRVLVLNRPGADARRSRLLARYPTKRGFDRDVPVAHRVPAAKTVHGSRMHELRRYCNGVRFRYVFY